MDKERINFICAGVGGGSGKKGATEKLNLLGPFSMRIICCPFCIVVICLLFAYFQNLIPKMSVQNISLYIPRIRAPMTENDLAKLLQETCHLGEIENIEMFEDLLIAPEQTSYAFVYFQHWYPTLGNQCLQVELMKTGKFLIPLDADRVLTVYPNQYFLTPSVSSEEAESEVESEAESETEMKEGDVEEFSEMENGGEEVEINEREIMEEQEEILFEQYYQEMEEVMRLMGEESFDLVSADYASRLETQLGALMYSTAPISVIQN